MGHEGVADAVESDMLAEEKADLARFATERPESLDQLTDRERRIFIARNSSDEHQARTLKELSSEYRVSQERIRQLEMQALRKILYYRLRDERKCQHCNGAGWV